MDDINFEVYKNDDGFIAIDDMENVGYGDTAQEAIDDLLESYGDVDFEVFDVTFDSLH